MLDRQTYPLEIARKVLKPETINDVRSGGYQFGLFDSGSMGAEQPRKAENAGGDGDFGFVGDSGSTGNHREQSTEQRGSRQTACGRMSDSEDIEKAWAST